MLCNKRDEGREGRRKREVDSEGKEMSGRGEREG